METIYIKLIDGTEVLVPVLAHNLESNIYKILENIYLDLVNDKTSFWEFFPGDTVEVIATENGLIANKLLFANTEFDQYRFEFNKISSS